MSEIDIDSMIEKTKKPVAKKSKQTTIKINPPKISNSSNSSKISNFLRNEKSFSNSNFLETDNKFIGEIPSEVNRFATPMIIKGLSLPAKDRKHILEVKLHNSEYTNKYLKKYLCVDKVAGLNDHLKMALVYGVNLIETMMIDVSRLQPNPIQQPPKSLDVLGSSPQNQLILEKDTKQEVAKPQSNNVDTKILDAFDKK